RSRLSQCHANPETGCPTTGPRTTGVPHAATQISRRTSVARASGGARRGNSAPAGEVPGPIRALLLGREEQGRGGEGPRLERGDGVRPAGCGPEAVATPTDPARCFTFGQFVRGGADAGYVRRGRASRSRGGDSPCGVAGGSRESGCLRGH